MDRRYVIYQRVSTDEQAEKGYSLEAMLEKCKCYIQSQEDGNRLVRVYEDRGYSGLLDPAKRPALNQLISEIRNKGMDFDTVLVWKLDRLSRSMRDTLNIEYILRKANIALESVTERVDTSTAGGKMFFNTVASFAEFESAQIGERTWNAMSSKVGQIHLGGKPPIGYRLVNNKYEIDSCSVDIIRVIFTLYLKKKNLSKVADSLNRNNLKTSLGKEWSHKKIKRVLMNPAYIGSLCWNRRNARLGRPKSAEKWVVRLQAHEPIISEDIFRKTQIILRKDM